MSDYIKSMPETVDIAVFAGQSNMSGRGNKSEAIRCRAGFEYKSVSRPETLLPITEPFGFGEDREGLLCDGAKRTGSMVSAAADEYYRLTGRRLVAVSASKGGTNTYEWRKTLIADAARRLDDTRKFLAENGIAAERIFVVWSQGESDGDAKTSAGDYIENTKFLFDAFKAHGASEIFIVKTGHYNYISYPNFNGGLTGAEWDKQYGIIRAAQTAMCENGDCVFAGSFEPYIYDMRDCFHYNQKAYNAVGRAVGKNIAKYYFGQ